MNKQDKKDSDTEAFVRKACSESDKTVAEILELTKGLPEMKLKIDAMLQHMQIEEFNKKFKKLGV